MVPAKIWLTFAIIKLIMFTANFNFFVFLMSWNLSKLWQNRFVGWRMCIQVRDLSCCKQLLAQSASLIFLQAKWGHRWGLGLSGRWAATGGVHRHTQFVSLSLLLHENMFCYMLLILKKIFLYKRTPKVGQREGNFWNSSIMCQADNVVINLVLEILSGSTEKVKCEHFDPNRL